MTLQYSSANKQECKMVKFIVGVVVGAVLATVGFTGVTKTLHKGAVVMDEGMAKVKKEVDAASK